MRVEKDYEDLLRLLNEHNVRYCIIGSYALAFYSVPRYTKDIDVLIGRGVENAQRVIDPLNDFGFESLGLTADDLIQEGNIIQLGYEPVRIDIITSIEGIEFSAVWQNREKGPFGDQEVNFIGLEDLIRTKQMSDRTQDMADLEVLLPLRKKPGE